MVRVEIGVKEKENKRMMRGQEKRREGNGRDGTGRDGEGKEREGNQIK